jgi:RNA polymerase sigma factor (sigma-70 family)
MSEANDSAAQSRSHGWFATTHWSVVLRAKEGDSHEAPEALGKLCQIYWPPIYAYLRRERHGPADAEDLTQAFFAHLLERKFLDHLHHRQGRFRSFLLAFLKHFLSDQRDKVRAQKRGGGHIPISLDSLDTAAREAFEPADKWTPDQAFERQWARTILQRALDRLREEYAANDRLELFEQLKEIQPGPGGSASYAEIGQRLGLAEGSVKSAVHRLRQRHRQLLREEISQTLTRPEEIAEEVRHLMAVVGLRPE